MWDLLFDWRAVIALGYDTAVYLIIAVAGTLLFLIRLAFTYFGGGGGDFEVDGDFDTDGAFTFFSVLSILAFFMGAGWMGLACRLDWGLGRLPSSLIAAEGDGERASWAPTLMPSSSSTSPTVSA